MSRHKFQNGERPHNRAARLFISALLMFSLFLPVKAAVGATVNVVSQQDIGNVTVMEISGNYNMTQPDGTYNWIARADVVKEFLRTHRDEYDFVVLFTNFDIQMQGDAGAFFSLVRNDVHGIGVPIQDNSSYYGSQGCLQGTIDMGDVSQKVMDPLLPGFETTLYDLTHEQMHRWGAYVKFIDPSGNPSTALLGLDGAHWSFLLDSNSSTLYGNHWINNGDGTFTSVKPTTSMDTGRGQLYSPLELYLMGIYDKSKVPSMLLINNPSVDSSQLPQVGVTINGEATWVTVDDIIAAEGARVPDAASAPKSFRTAFIYLALPGTVDMQQVHGIESLRTEWIKRFSILTDGKAIMEVTPNLPVDAGVPTNPGTTDPGFTPNPSPSADQGITWLMNSQHAEGYWQDSAETATRDTATAVSALRNFSVAGPNWQNGANWLATAVSVNTDFSARKIDGLSNPASAVNDLLLLQNDDGGWGSNAGYASNCADTALAVCALAKASYSGVALQKAIDFLKLSQKADGSWGVGSGTGMVQTSADVLTAFVAYRSSYSVDNEITKGVSWMVTKQNADGGFGNSPSTVYDSAAAVSALRKAGATSDVTDRGVAYLLSRQSANGSWNNSAFQTAMAVDALWTGQIQPDFSIVPSDITFTPSLATEVPVAITVNAAIHNLGSTSAQQIKVALYAGVPPSGSLIEAKLVDIAGNSVTNVAFSTSATAPGDNSYYVSVDIDQALIESSESNNTAAQVFTVNVPPPIISFSASTSTALESAGTVQLAVTLNHTWDEQVTVNYAANTSSTATNGSDFSLSTGTLTFAPGETSKNISVSIIDDSLMELNETAIVDLSNPTNGSLGVSRHTLTIIDDEPPTVNLISPVSGVTASTTPTLIYESSSGAAVVKVDGVVVNKASGDLLDPLQDGPHTVRIEVTNFNGFTGYSEVTFTVDTTPPSVKIVSPIAGVIPRDTPVLFYEVSDGQVVVKVDGVVVNKVNGDMLDSLIQGSHIVSIESTDNAGNVGLDEVNFLVFGPAPVETPYNISWIRQLPDGTGTSVVVDGAGNALVPGQSFTAKYDTNGNLLRANPYGSTISLVFPAIDSCGNILAVGVAGILNQTSDMLLTKIDSNGNVSWNRQWGSIQPDQPYGITVDQEGNASVTGQTRGLINGQWGDDHNEQIFLTKYDTNGTQLVNRQYAGFRGVGIVTDSSGYNYIVGDTAVNTLLGKYDSGGNMIWQTSTHGSFAGVGYGKCLAIDHDKSFFVAGSDIISKFDSLGNLVWTRHISKDPNTHPIISDITIDKYNKLYAVGDTAGNLNNNNNSGLTDIFVVKFDNRGNLLWTKLIGSTSYDHGYGIAIDDDGELFVEASGDLEGSGSSHSYLIKLKRVDAETSREGGTTYYIQSSSGCSHKTYNKAPVYATFSASSGICPTNDTVKLTFNGGPTDMLIAYAPNGGYAQDTLIKGTASGSFISFLAQDASGTGYVRLVEADPTTGSILQTLSTISIPLVANKIAYVGDFSALSGVVRAGNTFGIVLSMTTNARSTNLVQWGSSSNCPVGSKQWLTVYESPADSKAPTSLITSPANNTTISDSHFIVSGTANDGEGSGGETVEVSTDGGSTWNLATDTSGDGTWSSWQFPWILTTNGTYTIRSRAKDRSGNVELPTGGITVNVMR
jgi:hypothetical protein